jgi:hypothetical protein
MSPLPRAVALPWMMSNHDHLNASRAEELVRLAGGTARVARLLEQEQTEVVRWHFAGLEDSFLAVRLQNLAAQTTRARGRPRRSELMSLGEIKASVQRLGGVPKASEKLAVHPRMLRRYVRGDTVPPIKVVSRLRELTAPTAPPSQAKSAKERRQQLRQLAPPSLMLPLEWPSAKKVSHLQGADSLP